MIKWLKKLINGPARIELRLLPHSEADKLLVDPSTGWRIAKEEDNNYRRGMVYLERVV